MGVETSTGSGSKSFLVLFFKKEHSFLTQPDESPPASILSSLLLLAAYLVRQMRWRALSGIGLLLAGSLTEGFSIVLLIPIIELAGSGQSVHWPMPGFLSGLGRLSHAGLVPLLLGFVVVMMLRAVLVKHIEIEMSSISNATVNAMRTGLFKAIAFARWGFTATQRTADMDHALSAELNRVEFTVYQLFLLAQSIILLSIYVALSTLISPVMTGIAGVFGLVLFAALRPLRLASARFGERFSLQVQEQHRLVADFLASIKVAKSFNAEPIYVEKLSEHLSQTLRSNVKFVEISGNGAVLSQFITTCGLAAFADLAITQYHLAFSKMIIMLLVFMRLSPRIAAIQTSYHDIALHLPAYLLMRKLQAEFDAHQEMPPAQTRLTLNEGISFERVSFAYAGSGRGEILAASFQIPAYQVTALIGPSGSGKSTIADLILGLIEPTGGRILLDQTPLTGESHRAWRELAAYVPQDVFLMHDTIAANLCLANLTASEAEMWDALSAANARGFVEALPDRLATIVGDRGLRLSGGERQRIALARALLRRPLLLILDEGTSALDWENQVLVARSIENLKGKMTVLTIAHRPSMIAFADWVVALEGGAVLETGHLAEIMSRPGSYLRRMVSEETMQ